MRISCAEVIEIFGDSDSENGDDFASFSYDDNECRNDGVSIAYDEFAGDSDLDNYSEMGPT